MAYTSRFKLAVLGVSLALAACGGGSGGTTPAAPGGSKPAAASAALSFFVPSASSAIRARRPAYLPSNTASVVITVLNSDGTQLTPAVAPTVANVGPTAPGCSAVSGGLQCIVNVAASTGSLLFSVAAYDQTNGAGNVLSVGSTVATIGGGPNTVSITLAAAAQYGAISLGGKSVGIMTLDHQAHTFSFTAPSNTFTTSGTYTALPNGDLKLIVTASTDASTIIGEVVYARELAGGAIAFMVTGSTSPQPNGASSGTNTDWGLGTAMQPCATSSYTLQFAGVSLVGPAFAPASTTAYTTGAASITPGALTFNGTKFLLSGANNGTDSGNTQTCANGIYTETSSDGAAVPGAQGFVLSANGNNTNGGQTQATDVGTAGFVPSQTLNLAAIASQSYEAFEGTQVVNGNMTAGFSAPLAASPAAANTLTACPYVNFEANSVDTSTCTTVTLTSQIGPGLLSGTATDPTSGSTPFVAAVGTVDGKYLITVISASATTGAVNLVFMQH